MHITLETARLSAALMTLKRTVEKRNTIPILMHVLISADTGGAVTMTATDLDQAVTITLDGDVVEAGAAALNAHALADLVKGLDKGSRIAIQTNQSNPDELAPPAIIRSGLTRMTLNTVQVSDFPAWAPGEERCAFTIGAHVLRRALTQTSFAISTEETRYYLNGVFMHYAEKEAELRFVATDGHRLALVRINPPVGAHALPPVIIPRKAVVELEKTLAKSRADETIGIQVRTVSMMPSGAPLTVVEFTYGRTVLLTKRIDGTFPNYERVIPYGNQRRLAFEPVAVAAVVRRVSAMSSDLGRTVVLDFDGDMLDVSVINPNRGTISERAPASAAAFDGEPLRIGYSATYLLDVLAHLGDESAVAHFDDAVSPAVFRTAESSSEIFVLMPCRV